MDLIVLLTNISTGFWGLISNLAQYKCELIYAYFIFLCSHLCTSLIFCFPAFVSLLSLQFCYLYIFLTQEFYNILITAIPHESQ